MNTLFFIFCFLLVLANFTFVYYIRSSRTFAIYPGLLTVLLFLGLGAYLIYMLVSISPTPPPKAKDYKQSVYLRKYARDQSTYIYHKQQMEIQLTEQIENVGFLLNLLFFQSLLSLTAAIVGSRLVKQRKNYYYWIVALYIGLLISTQAAQYLIHHRHA